MIVSGMTLPLMAPTVASGSGSKIQHLIFIVQENHSFDNYFGTYPGVNGLPVDVAVPLDPNQTSLGYVKPFHLDVSQPIMIWAMNFHPVSLIPTIFSLPKTPPPST